MVDTGAWRNIGERLWAVRDHVRDEDMFLAREALDQGCNFTRPSTLEIDCAKEYFSLVTGAEMVKFCKDGSDATSGAVKLARAYTGRDLIAFAPTIRSSRSTIAASAQRDECRQPRAATRKLTVSFRYNDISSVRALFERHNPAACSTALSIATASHRSPTARCSCRKRSSAVS